ncbi:MAG: FAD-binding oxidoreductase [Bacteroidota bacterium]|nr:FAD-binding oxidoreductase [Bacteroidota bacterium]
MLDLRSGVPYWLIKNGLPYSYPKLRQSIKTDVVILGGGISGALCSWYLTHAGIENVVIDARSIGLGSTSASTGLLQYEIDTPLVRLAEITGRTNAVRAYLLGVDAIDQLADIASQVGYKDFIRKPSLYYAALKTDIDFLKSEFAIRDQSGIEVEFLSGNDIQKDYGFKSEGAILSSQAAQVDPYGFTHAILQHVIDKGTTVYDRSPVDNIQEKRDGVNLKTKQGVMIRAKKIVYANGYEVSKMLSKKIVSLHSTYASISENPDTSPVYWKDNALMWSTASPYLYLRTTTDGRLIIGGRDENFFNPDKRDAHLKKKNEQLVKDFSKLFPHLSFLPEYSWAGTFGSTADGLPFIGAIREKPNSFFSLGFGGNGITFGLIGARMVTDMVLGKKNPDQKLFAFDRNSV